MGILDFFKESFSIKGRMGIGRYWLFTSIHFLLAFSLLFSFPIFGGSIFTFGLWLIIFIVIYTNVVFITLMCKRLHDLDTSAVYMIPIWIIGWIPLIGLLMYLIIAFLPGTKGPNKYGPQPGAKTGEDEVIITV